MKGLAYIIIALSVISAFTWIALYTRDNSPMVAQYSTSFKANATSRIYLWLIEGWANVSLFAPPCQVVDLIVYREGDGSILYWKSFEGPKMELVQVNIPLPGYYTFHVASRRVEGCQAPDILGTFTVYQWGQPEFKLRNLSLIATSILLAPGIIIIAYTILRSR
ncbi:MAG: hypothetical protein P3X22_007870 [Thermoprotei archaeon]|nr:hypothetical protein [Thermoprotei archaeon]